METRKSGNERRWDVNDPYSQVLMDLRTTALFHRNWQNILKDDCRNIFYCVNVMYHITL